jgi:hypothetical protein
VFDGISRPTFFSILQTGFNVKVNHFITSTAAMSTQISRTPLFGLFAASLRQFEIAV